MMLKEMIQMLMQQPEKINQLLSGKLRLTGVSTLEQRALFDVLNQREEDIQKVGLSGWY